MTSTVADRSSSAWERALPWLFLAAGLLTTFWPVLVSGFGSLQVYYGDPRLVNYVLEHTYRWIGGDPLHAAFWSPPIFHPAQGTGAYTDTMVGVAPPYWAFRALGLDGGLAMQAWIVAVFCLNFLASFLLLRSAFGLRSFPASAGSFLFAFGSPRLANFNSPQLFPVFCGILSLWVLHRAHRAWEQGRPRRGWIALFSGLLALQAWSTFYPTFFLVLILGVALLVALVQRESRGVVLGMARADGVAWILGAVLAALAVVPMARAHLEGAEEVGWRSYELTSKNLPTLASWVFPGRTNRLYGGLYGAGPFAFEKTPSSQHANGFGLVTTCFCLFGLWTGRRRVWVRVLLGTTLCVLLLATKWPWGGSAWRAVYELVPGARAIRYPARIGQFLAIPAALGIALFVEWVVARRRPVLCGAALLLALAEQLHEVKAYDEDLFRRSVAEVARHVDPDAESFYVSLDPAARRKRGAPDEEDPDDGGGPGGVPPRRLVHLLAMWAGLAAEKPTLNGSYGNIPPGWGLMQGEESQLLHWAGIHGLDPRRITWLEIEAEWHPRTHPEVEVRTRPLAGR